MGFVSFKGFEGKGIRRRDCRFFMWRELVEEDGKNARSHSRNGANRATISEET